MTRDEVVRALELMSESPSLSFAKVYAMTEAIRRLDELPRFEVDDTVTHPACTNANVTVGRGVVQGVCVQVGEPDKYLVDTANGQHWWVDEFLNPAIEGAPDAIPDGE